MKKSKAKKFYISLSAEKSIFGDFVSSWTISSEDSVDEHSEREIVQMGAKASENPLAKRQHRNSLLPLPVEVEHLMHLNWFGETFELDGL